MCIRDRAGGTAVVITAKDKLHLQLSKGMDFSSGCIAFSSEKADQATVAHNGIEGVLDLVGMPLPDV